MREIPLTKGKVALVDDEDYDALVVIGWSASWSGRAFYARGWFEGKMVYMHRMIMGFPSSKVDHRDTNTLNNQRSNLRSASTAQNGQNRGPNHGRHRKGVYLDGRTYLRKRWEAAINIDGRKVHLGRYSTEDQAAAAYDKAAVEAWGEFALKNLEAA